MTPMVDSNVISSLPGAQLSSKFSTSLARASLISIKAKRIPVGLEKSQGEDRMDKMPPSKEEP